MPSNMTKPELAAARRQIKRQCAADISRAKAEYRKKVTAALQAEDEARAAAEVIEAEAEAQAKAKARTAAEAAEAEPRELVDLRNKRERAYRKLEKLDAAIAKYEKALHERRLQDKPRRAKLLQEAQQTIQKRTPIDKRTIEHTHKLELDDWITQREAERDAAYEDLDAKMAGQDVARSQARARRKYDAIHNKLEGMSGEAPLDDSIFMDPKFNTKRKGYELALKNLHSELSAEDLASALRKEERIRETFRQCRRDMDRYNNSMATIEARAAQDQAEYEAKLKAEQEYEDQVTYNDDDGAEDDDLS